jgi:adenine deaminase
MHKLKSSFLYGVGEDAGYIASRIAHDQKQVGDGGFA